MRGRQLIIFSILLLILIACHSAKKVSRIQPSVSAVNNYPSKEIEKNDCITCHGLNEKRIGPAFMQVSKRYDSTDTNINRLARKIISGGTGVWGNIPMTPHPNMTEEEARAIVKYILSLKNQ